MFLICFSLPYYRLCVLEHFQIDNKIERKVQRFAMWPLPPPSPHHMHSFSVINIPYQSGTFVTTDGLSDTSLSLKSPQLTLGFTLGLYILSLDKFVITFICYYSFMQNVLSALKILLALPFHSSLPSNLIYCYWSLACFQFYLVNTLEL